MAVHLHARAVFTWPEWAQALALQIAAPHDAVTDEDEATLYYRHWLAALEQLVASKGVASQTELQRCAAAWDAAADRTPHGESIALHPGDFATADLR